MTEDWPTRPAAHLFYAQEKAEIEQLLLAEAAAHPELGLYLLRPPIVLGPHAVGAKELLPEPPRQLGRRARRARPQLARAAAGARPALPLQFIHEDDVGQALPAVHRSAPARRAPTTSPATAC